MIILLEGADVTGKTTLANTMLEALKNDAVYFKHDNTNNSILEFSRTIALAHEWSREGKVAIIDRLWLSEAVYGPIMRDHTNDSDGTVMQLCHLYGVVTVVCVRENMTKHLNHFRQMEKVRSEYAAAKIESIIRVYHALWYGESNSPVQGLLGSLIKRTPLRMLRSYYQYDMDKFKPDEFANWLLRMRDGNKS